MYSVGYSRPKATGPVPNRGPVGDQDQTQLDLEEPKTRPSYYCALSGKGPSIKYVTLEGGGGPRRCDNLWQGEGVKSM